MGKRGPQGVLDEYKKREICALLTLGSSRAVAARFVGCAPNTIKNTAKREPEFAYRMKRAKANCEKECLRNIFHSGAKSWRASAWILERTRPQQYEKISQRRASGKQLDNFWSEAEGDFLADLPDEQQAMFRERFLQVKKKFTRSLAKRKEAEGEEDAEDVVELEATGDNVGVAGVEQREPPAASASDFLPPRSGTPGRGDGGEGPESSNAATLSVLPDGTCQADAASTPGPARQARPTDSEFHLRYERSVEQMARTRRDNELLEAENRRLDAEQAAAGIPPEKRERMVWFKSIHGPVVGLLLWLAAFAALRSSNMAPALLLDARSTDHCLVRQPEPTVERAPASEAGAMRLRQNLARLPCDVAPIACNVSLVPTLRVGTRRAKIDRVLRQAGKLDVLVREPFPPRVPLLS